MKNLTITLRDEIADWLRVEAAKAEPEEIDELDAEF